MFVTPHKTKILEDGNASVSAQSEFVCLRYDLRCYFNVCSKADMSQLDLLQDVNNFYGRIARGARSIIAFSRF